MNIDDVFRLARLHGVPINNLDRCVMLTTTAGEYCDMIRAAYNAGRKERESEQAEVIAANPLEAKVPT